MTRSRARVASLIGAAIGTAAVAAVLAAWPASPHAQAAQPSTAACDITTTERIVAIGDVHGAYDRFVAILRAAGLIDRRRRWTGGRAILVQTGDLVDRGAKSRDVLDLLRRLETSAAKAGGQVITLVGNHEVMRMQGFVRDASPAESAAFRSPASADLRDGLYQVLVARQREQPAAEGAPFDERAYRKTFYETTPLGLVEMLRAFAPTGDYGRWLRTRGAIVRINGVVFVHGGVSPAVAMMGCAGLDTAMRAEITGDAVAVEGVKPLVDREDGPLWYRGFVRGDVTAAEVDAALSALGARAIVVGHTPTADMRIQSLFGGKVFAIDTGMLGEPHYPHGVASAIEFHNGSVTAIYETGRVEGLGRVEKTWEHLGASGARGGWISARPAKGIDPILRSPRAPLAPR